MKEEEDKVCWSRQTVESFLLNPFALALRRGINFVPVLVDVAWDALVPLS